MSQEFVHLRMHTEFSIRDGMIKPKKIFHRAVAAGMKALAMTDLSAMFGAVIFYKAALGAGVKPILGADVWITNDYNRGEPFRMLLLCRNSEGYHSLCKLLSDAWLTNQFEGRGEIRSEWITPEVADGFICISGFNDSAIGKALLHNAATTAENEAKKMADLFPGRFYLEVQRVGRPNDEKLVQQTIKLAKKMNLPVVATQPIQFEEKDDFECHEARVAISDGFTLANKDRPKIFTPEQYFKSAEEMIELFKDIPSAVENTVEIAKRCNLTLNLGKPLLPIFPTPDGLSLKDYMAKLAREGLDRRLKVLYPDKKVREEKFPEYSARLEHEIKIIQEMDFPGYFLIVQDFINWAKTHGCPVGPGRGSGAGSLVAYSLGITDLDPLEYDLLFERFLNPERVSMPDFDVDFCQNNRGRVIEYVKQKYGDDAVSQIATFGTMGAKGVIKDVGRVFDVSYNETDRLARMIPTNPGKPLTLRDALEQIPEFKNAIRNDPVARRIFKYAIKLEGTCKSLGIHAGGVLIARGRLIDFTPLYAANMLPENVISQYDKKDVEAVGLVKFDFLGLTTLTIIERALNYIEKNGHKRPDIGHVDITDKKVYKDIFCKGDTAAVFQFESPGMRNLLVRAQPTKLADLIALNALYRPGPMDLIDDYIAVRDGEKQAEYADERLRPILEETSGIMVYQEQVMLVAQTIGGYSLGSADILRRAMGKKDVAEMERQSKVFIAGAAKNGVDEPTATHLFELMRKFAGYGFNKSHAAAYSFVAYQTAWLKEYYPAEFLASSLCEVMTNATKMLALIKDARNHGITVLGPDINKSDYYFTTPDSKTIRMGLGALKGVGEAAVNVICEERAKNGPYKSIFDLAERVGSQVATKRILEVFSLGGAFDSIDPNRNEWYSNIDRAFLAGQESGGDKDQMGLFGDDEPMDDALLDKVRPWKERTRLEMEKSILGFYFSGHPTKEYAKEVKEILHCCFADEVPNSKSNWEGVVAGTFLGIQVRNKKEGGQFVTVTIEVNDNPYEYTMDFAAYTKNKETYSEIPVGELVLVDLKVSGRPGGKAWSTARDLFPLYYVRSQKKAKLVLYPAKGVSPDQLLALIEKAKFAHLGATVPVYVNFEKNDARALIQLPEKYSVAADWKIINDLEECSELDNVQIIYGKRKARYEIN